MRAIRRPDLKIRRILSGAVAALCCWATAARSDEPAAAGPRVLSSVREVRSLTPAEAAAGPRVLVHGIVTRATPHELFIQDGADAIFVAVRVRPGCRLGDYVEVPGTVASGHLLPLIISERIRIIDHRQLPRARPIHYYELTSEREDCQWVEVEGVVRSVERAPWDSLTLQLAFDGTLLRLKLSDILASEPPQIIGARVRVRGVVNGAKTSQRQIIEPSVWAAFTPETFEIETPGPADIFAIPLEPAKTLLDHISTDSGEMVRVSGIVTGQCTPNSLFIRDGDDSLEVRLQQAVPFQPGDRVEAVGFPEMGAVKPVLLNAVPRRLSIDAAPLPIHVRPRELLNFKYEAALVQFDGELRGLFERPSGVFMVVSTDDVLVRVDLDRAVGEVNQPLPQPGSRVSLVGICQIDHLTSPDVFQVVVPASFRLRLRSVDDVRVLTRPTWWTPRRLLTSVAVLGVSCLAALGWVWTLNRRVRAQTRVILDSARTAAMQEERYRIAREFHDTLEQQLAGATILLDAIATVVVQQPERAKVQLVTARAMLRHSLDEAQTAVADLRDNNLVQRSLKFVIEEKVRELVGPAATTVQFHHEGDWPELDSVVKKHVLRIVQESVTNALKHAAATCITVAMRASAERIEIRVTDNGRGFDVRQPSRGGQFGLIGLQERADRIRAKLTIDSEPAHGTTVAVALAHHQVSTAQ